MKNILKIVACIAIIAWMAFMWTKFGIGVEVVSSITATVAP